MSTIVEVWPAKDPREEVFVEFNFSDAGTITTPEVTVTTYSRFGATDPAPAGILSGAPAIMEGNQKVRQKVVGGVDLVDYYIDCRARTAAGEWLVIPAMLPVREK